MDLEKPKKEDFIKHTSIIAEAMIQWVSYAKALEKHCDRLEVKYNSVLGGFKNTAESDEYADDELQK